MATPILIDTGPLVATLNKRDQWHQWVVEEIKSIEPPFLTCEAVISETLFLLRQTRGDAVKGLLHLLESGIVDLSFSLDKERVPVAALLKKYGNVPMALADACLVRMAELHAGASVFTIDADFRIYRMAGRKVIPTIAPPLG